MKIESRIYPVSNLGETIIPLYHTLGLATSQSPAGWQEINPDHRMRSPITRVARHRLIAEARLGLVPPREASCLRLAYDQLDRHFQNPAELSIDMDSLGIQCSHFVNVSLPIMAAGHNRLHYPPLIFLPAYAGGYLGIESLIRAAALSGRRVIGLDWPETHLGHTTEQYAQAVESGMPYEIHTRFAAAAIHQIIGDKKYNLAGYSGGGAVALKLARDPVEGCQIVDLAAIAPPSLLDRTRLPSRKISGYPSWVILGLASELVCSIRHDLQNLASAGITPDKVADNEEQSRRQRITAAWFDWIPRQVNLVSDLKNMGHTLVVSADHDSLTHSFSADTGPVPHVVIKNFCHTSLASRAEKIWQTVEHSLTQS